VIEDIKHRFNYHAPPHYGVVAAHTAIRQACLEAAKLVDLHVPAGRERALALTKLEEAMMWGNAGIARNHDAIPVREAPDCETSE
jgi:hypothetical protein